MLGQFRLNSFRLCLAVPERIAEPARNFTPNVLRGSVVATSYPALTRQYLDSIGAKNVTVKTLSGNVEAAPRDLGAKAITDIVQTGGSLKCNGLAEISTLLTCAMELFSLREAEIAPVARAQMQNFAQRLRANSACLIAA